MASRSLAVAVVLLGLGAGACREGEGDPALTLEALLERNAEALGGRAQLDRLRSVWRQRSERVFTFTKRPSSHLVYVRSDDGRLLYAEGIDGDVAWEHHRTPGRVEVEGRPKVALWQTLQLPRTLNPLHRVRERGHRLTYLGRELIDEVRYHAVRLELTNGFVTYAYLHPETFLVERSTNVRRHHARDPEEKRIETVWSDFRTIEGYVFPFVEIERDLTTGERLAGGEPMLRIVPNPDIPDRVFGLDGAYAPLLAPLATAGRAPSDIP